jgi:hypothetical protein
MGIAKSSCKSFTVPVHNCEKESPSEGTEKNFSSSSYLWVSRLVSL